MQDYCSNIVGDKLDFHTVTGNVHENSKLPLNQSEDNCSTVAENDRHPISLTLDDVTTKFRSLTHMLTILRV